MTRKNKSIYVVVSEIFFAEDSNTLKSSKIYGLVMLTFFFYTAVFFLLSDSQERIEPYKDGFRTCFWAQFVAFLMLFLQFL